MIRRALTAVVVAVTVLILIGAGLTAVVTSAGAADVVVALVVGIGSLAALAAVVAILVARSWRPIRHVLDVLAALAEGRYSARVPRPRAAPLRPVAASVNELARRLESAEAARRQLLADLGHELRTPLTVVRGGIEALLDGVHRPDQEHLETLLAEVAVTERLIEDLRTLSMSDAGVLSLHVEPVEVGDLVADTVDSHRSRAQSEGVVLSTKQVGVGEAALDPIRMREVVSNLIVNALNATVDGDRVDISVTGHPDAVEIEVADTGRGIRPADVDHVFDRFVKGPGSDGTGLGLTISRDLVRAHGGSISLTSELGVGTVVTVRLPR